MSNEFFEVFDIGLCKLKNTLTGEKIGANYKIGKLTSAQNKFISYKHLGLVNWIKAKRKIKLIKKYNEY